MLIVDLADNSCLRFLLRPNRTVLLRELFFIFIFDINLHTKYEELHQKYEGTEPDQKEGYEDPNHHQYF